MNLIGGRGDCSSLARKLPARGQQAGHCGMAAQVMPVAVAGCPKLRGTGSRFWQRCWGAGAVPLGLEGVVIDSKEWTERRMGGWERGEKDGYLKKKLELQSIKLLA